ncbi:hypothetical protein [Wielerella bovis]|uniref:hypothetical protein n=1 Tax=Wielerella bovis TaxID=2917790 RepID=UPI0020190FC0|nr:hypothetical protein [Wielerella bovis]ULJ63008.1 hypothetical protein MIS46_02825 [Wielerella bovis]ULJ65239.1 hypothetical protein MIS33_02890 [Wielerella bovis]ULJ67586.1 hypothetical protein MIS31_03265 [Wielerella bovis]
MQAKWVYREESKFIMLLPFLVLFLIGSAPLIAFVVCVYTGEIKLSISLLLNLSSERKMGILGIFAFSAIFWLLAYGVYRLSLRKWLKSLFRNNPNCFIIDETGFYHHLNQQEILIQWHEIEAIYFTEYSIRKLSGLQKLHLKCHNGHEEVIDLHEFGSWQGQIFIPYLFLFGTMTVFNKLLMVFCAVGTLYLIICISSNSKERKQQIIQIIHFYQYDKLLTSKASHYYFSDSLHFDD